MTIAAGFKVREGILLCADTRLTGDIKLDRSKLQEVEVNPGVKTVFAFAGDEYLARMAIEECRDNLRSQLEENSSLQKLKSVIRGTLKVLIADCPDYHLQLLIGVRIDSDLRLLAAYDALVKEVETYECIGSGDQIAHYVLNKSFKYFDTLSLTRFRATHALLAAKDINEPCGGHSEMILLCADGSVEKQAPRPTALIEESITKYESLSAEVLWTLFDRGMDDSQFNLNFQCFYGAISELRKRYRTYCEGLDMLSNLPELPQQPDEVNGLPDVISDIAGYGGATAPAYGLPDQNARIRTPDASGVRPPSASDTQ